MSEFALFPIHHSEEIPEIKFGLILTNPQEIPHVSLVYKEELISLTVNGVSRKNYSDYTQGISRKKIPSLFIEIRSPESVPQNILPEFQKFENVSEEGVSCIEPVKSSLSDLVSIDFSSCSFVYEITDLLIKYDLITRVFAMNLKSYFSGDRFIFRKYGREEVNRSIINYKKGIISSYAASRG